MDTYLTVAEVAELLHLSRVHTYRLIAKGSLPSVRVGERRVLVPVNKLWEVLEATAS